MYSLSHSSTGISSRRPCVKLNRPFLAIAVMTACVMSRVPRSRDPDARTIPNAASSAAPTHRRSWSRPRPPLRTRSCVSRDPGAQGSRGRGAESQAGGQVHACLTRHARAGHAGHGHAAQALERQRRRGFTVPQQGQRQHHVGSQLGSVAPFRGSYRTPRHLIIGWRGVLVPGKYTNPLSTASESGDSTPVVLPPRDLPGRTGPTPACHAGNRGREQFRRAAALHST